MCRGASPPEMLTPDTDVKLHLVVRGQAGVNAGVLLGHVAEDQAVHAAILPQLAALAGHHVLLGTQPGDIGSLLGHHGGEHGAAALQHQQLLPLLLLVHEQHRRLCDREQGLSLVLGRGTPVLPPQGTSRQAYP